MGWSVQKQALDADIQRLRLAGDSRARLRPKSEGLATHEDRLADAAIRPGANVLSPGR
jgi:hypothetical protein